MYWYSQFTLKSTKNEDGFLEGQTPEQRFDKANRAKCSLLNLGNAWGTQYYNVANFQNKIWKTVTRPTV